MRLRESLLWIDCSAGLLAGVFALSLAGFLSSLYGLPLRLLIVMGMANLLYATFSFSLARRRTRPPAMLRLLVIANATWAVLCAVTAVRVAETATGFGIAQLVLESVFVGSLAGLEWRHREALRTAS